MSEEKELSIKTIFLILTVALLIFWHAVIYFIYWGLT